MFFQVVQTVYWLALSAWFGGVVFLSIAWPIIVRTLRDRDPILPDVLSVNLQGQHGIVLGGEIVGNLQAVLVPIELACAGALLISIVAQWFVTNRDDNFMIVRTLLFISAVIFLIYDWRGVWPKIRRHRQEFLDHADEPDLANAARDMLGYYHRQSVNVLTILFLLLLGLILFSGVILPTPHAFMIASPSH